MSMGCWAAPSRVFSDGEEDGVTWALAVEGEAVVARADLEQAVAAAVPA